MASIREMKATKRERAGTGGARAERRAGRIPGIIYGDGKDPMPISLDFQEVRLRIQAGHFLTSVYDLEVEGVRQRVIPRDYQLDPVKDFPLHVDFMRLGAGATIRVNVPVHVQNAEIAPGVKRGGTVNIVTHAVELRCPADAIPESIDVDVSGLDLTGSIHLSDIKLPENVRPVAGAEEVTLVTIVAPSGLIEEQRAAAEGEAAPAEAAPAAAAPEKKA